MTGLSFPKGLTSAAADHLSPGDRLVYIGRYGAYPPLHRVVTVNNINKNVPPGEEPEISIMMGPDGHIRDTVFRLLQPYETPAFPPGIILKDIESIKQQDEIYEYMEYMLDDEEKKILNEINEDFLIDTLTPEGYGNAISELASEDMDNFEDLCNRKEARHALLARSPQGAGIYLQPHGVQDDGCWNYRWSDFGTMECVRDGKSIQSLPERKKWATDPSELNVDHRVMVEATILHKGVKHDNAVSGYGKIYIDKKFTKYLPNVGDKVSMVIGMKGCTASHPWNCYYIC